VFASHAKFSAQVRLKFELYLSQFWAIWAIFEMNLKLCSTFWFVIELLFFKLSRIEWPLSLGITWAKFELDLSYFFYKSWASFKTFLSRFITWAELETHLCLFINFLCFIRYTRMKKMVSTFRRVITNDTKDTLKFRIMREILREAIKGELRFRTF
jgi:hypothetical protein